MTICIHSLNHIPLSSTESFRISQTDHLAHRKVSQVTPHNRPIESSARASNKNHSKQTSRLSGKIGATFREPKIFSIRTIAEILLSQL